MTFLNIFPIAPRKQDLMVFANCLLRSQFVWNVKTYLMHCISFLNGCDEFLHTRLRTKCSALNHDLFLKNITESPLCRCGDIENTYHFFSQCPHYRNSRTELFESVSQYKEISLDLLLFGDISLPYDTNEKIFGKVQKYIITTKRFTAMQ